jgi:hypothetical protein
MFFHLSRIRRIGSVETPKLKSHANFSLTALVQFHGALHPYIDAKKIQMDITDRRIYWHAVKGIFAVDRMRPSREHQKDIN